MVAQHPNGIRAGELNRKILETNLYQTERGSPAKSTLYHCRNTLINLGVVERNQRLLTVAVANPLVRRLLDAPLPKADCLSTSARRAFSDLVLQNPDCLRQFFAYFLSANTPVDARQFAAVGQPLIWHPRAQTQGFRVVELQSPKGDTVATLESPVAIRSVLYGVRYWARDELQIIDEFFETGRGSIMYPVRFDTSDHDATALMFQILNMPADSGDWTTVSLNTLLRLFCETKRYRVSTLFDAIRAILVRHPSHVVLIPTIPNFAAISATTRKREAFELQGYFTDGQGRLISHIRFHNALRGAQHG